MQQPDMEQLGQRLAHARERRGWNQSVCAKQAGVHRATLALLEQGKKPHVRSDMLFTLARALGCTSDYLLGLTDDDTEEEAA